MRASRRIVLTAATSLAAAVWVGGRWARPFAPRDGLPAWADLLDHRSAAARVGRLLEAELPARDLQDLLHRQRSRFAAAVVPSIDRLRESTAF